MEAIRKQATKLREQVAKQQQAVLRRLGSLSSETAMIDEDELLCHQQIQNLYNSTKAAKHFQRSIVRGVEGFISISSKQIEIVRKLAEQCCKYGDTNEAVHPPLAGASTYFGSMHNSMEKERESLLTLLGEKVCDPLRAQINGAPLEDARHLAHRYDKLRQDVDAQVGEVLRRRSKSTGPSASEESLIKLQNAETRLNELKSSIMALGREASAAMLSVEEHQLEMTFNMLLTMVDAERCYHQKALSLLDQLHDEMTLEKQPQDLPSSPSSKIQKDVDEWLENQQNDRFANHKNTNEDDAFFIAKVIHQFDAQAEGELSLSVDDFVVVHQVAADGWSEGLCNGNSGWFPSAYVLRQDKAVVTKIT